MPTSQNKKTKIIVGMASCGIAAGAADVYAALEKKIAEEKLPIQLEKTGCIGACYREPLMEIQMEGFPTVIYGDVTLKKIPIIFAEHIGKHEILKDWVVTGDGI